MFQPPSISDRALPTLISLPIPKFKRRNSPVSKRSGPQFNIKKPSINNKIDTPNSSDPYTQAVTLAVDSLCAVIDLTLTFLNPKPTYAKNVVKWLLELRSTLDTFEASIQDICLDHDITIDTEGPSYLDDILGIIPDLNSDEDNFDECTRKLLSFWLDEIERRGWELFHISVNAMDLIDATKTFSEMASLRYPLK